ncbi:Sua5/YciO/YrdC/YwlC family protein [Corallincola platygyrae]|uniref:Threonylcarbamoyl-AMP synthase n=1 Tax=Corallincola platygyrae TaxID=1193278 RepID=A0ABW4XL29_9GAMM
MVDDRVVDDDYAGDTGNRGLPTAMYSDALLALQQQQLIAYPTEAVFGLGCDPDSEAAVNKLLELKQRPIEKGLILVAASVEQLTDYIALDTLDEQQWKRIEASWPGPNTWVIPKQVGVPEWLSGKFDSLAVRVSAHPVVQELCLAYGKPIVSTSANLTGEPPCRTYTEVKAQLGDRLGAIVDAPCGPSSNPTQIRDALTNQVLRPS